MPFWFWNDRLDESELLRQVADFEAHGVYGFVIHPRVGLPRDLGWMSPRLLGLMRVVIEEAARRDMRVILYDEAVYPSGSSCGQVVAENPAYACRGLACIELAEGDGPELPRGHSLVCVARRENGQRLAIVDRPAGSHIRGLHYIDDDPPRHPGPDSASPGMPRPDPREDQPPAADLLNPKATACFIRLVYQRYFDEFGKHFGKTIPAIFTDEPMLLGRGAPKGLMPGTTGILEHVNRILGYDFAPHLAALWYSDEPDAARHREDYHRAISTRMEETFYAPIHEWCLSHGVALTGHPDADDKIGLLRHFDMPGQDLVWRYVEPDKATALEGGHSTMAKCSSSAMVHLGRRRNANEFCGAYGRGLTFSEMKWLGDWCIVRGVNLLVPHAFYYSLRGPRVDERPPDVGPNSAWWNEFKPMADHFRRLCWLNTDSRHVCRVAVLGRSDRLPWQAAKVLFEHQVDFNYIEERHLWEDAQVDGTGIRLAGMHYAALVVDAQCLPSERAGTALERLQASGRVIPFDARRDVPSEFIGRLDAREPRDLTVTPAQPNLRYRHVIKAGRDYYILFNEGSGPLECRIATTAEGAAAWLDPWSGCERAAEGELALKLGGRELVVLRR